MAANTQPTKDVPNDGLLGPSDNLNEEEWARVAHRHATVEPTGTEDVADEGDVGEEPRWEKIARRALWHGFGSDSHDMVQVPHGKLSRAVHETDGVLGDAALFALDQWHQFWQLHIDDIAEIARWDDDHREALAITFDLVGYVVSDMRGSEFSSIAHAERAARDLAEILSNLAEEDQ